MKKLENKILNASNRFLIGLICALSLTLVAFEWTTVRYDEIIIEDYYEPISEDDPEILPILVSKKEVVKPQPKANTSTIEVIESFTEEIESEDEGEEQEEEANLEIDPSLYGDEEELPEEIHPTIDFKKMEIYPHTDACIGLYGEQMKHCSQEEIGRLIKSRIKIPNILYDIGGRQGVFLEFTVNKEGYVEDVVIKQKTNDALANEAVKTLKNLPKFNPAIQNGMAVNMRMEVPIVIDIRP